MKHVPLKYKARYPVHQSAMEHSENKIITYMENEAGPGVLQSSVQQTYTLRDYFQTTMTESKYNQWPILFAFDNDAAHVFPERCAGAL